MKLFREELHFLVTSHSIYFVTKRMIIVLRLSIPPIFLCESLCRLSCVAVTGQAALCNRGGISCCNPFPLVLSMLVQSLSNTLMKPYKGVSHSQTVLPGKGALLHCALVQFYFEFLVAPLLPPSVSGWHH